ncbi:hypothetical protein SNEBB_005892 [Seison nebaliae]|nr:hypothetical protein SNEBB_005892 [Seison nebaliae]
MIEKNLGKLLNLLRIGEDLNVKLAASKQIAEYYEDIELTPPAINSICRKLLDYMMDNNSDTRVATSKTMGLISKKLSIYLLDYFETKNREIVEFDRLARDFGENYLYLERKSYWEFYRETGERINIFNDLGRTRIRLLGSFHSNMNAHRVGEQDLKKQRLQFHSQFLGVPANLSMDKNEGINVIETKDLQIPDNFTEQQFESEEVEMKLEKLFQFKLLRNDQLKLIISRGLKSFPSILKNDLADNGKLIFWNSIQPKNQWLWLRFIDRELKRRLFATNWIERHGAVLSLHEIMDSLFEHLNLQLYLVERKDDDLTIEEKLKKASYLFLMNWLFVWVKDLMVRVFFLIFIDNFGDFSSDVPSYPVREAAAQFLGMLTKHLVIFDALEMKEKRLKLIEDMFVIINENLCRKFIELDTDYVHITLSNIIIMKYQLKSLINENVLTFRHVKEGVITFLSLLINDEITIRINLNDKDDLLQAFADAIVPLATMFHENGERSDCERLNGLLFTYLFMEISNTSINRTSISSIMIILSKTLNIPHVEFETLELCDKGIIMKVLERNSLWIEHCCCRLLVQLSYYIDNISTCISNRLHTLEALTAITWQTIELFLLILMKQSFVEVEIDNHQYLQLKPTNPTTIPFLSFHKLNRMNNLREGLKSLGKENHMENIRNLLSESSNDSSKHFQYFINDDSPENGIRNIFSILSFTLSHFIRLAFTETSPQILVTIERLWNRLMKMEFDDCFYMNRLHHFMLPIGNSYVMIKNKVIFNFIRRDFFQSLLCSAAWPWIRLLSISPTQPIHLYYFFSNYMASRKFWLLNGYIERVMKNDHGSHQLHYCNLQTINLSNYQSQFISMISRRTVLNMISSFFQQLSASSSQLIDFNTFHQTSPNNNNNNNNRETSIDLENMEFLYYILSQSLQSINFILAFFRLVLYTDIDTSGNGETNHLPIPFLQHREKDFELNNNEDLVQHLWSETLRSSLNHSEIDYDLDERKINLFNNFQLSQSILLLWKYLDVENCFSLIISHHFKWREIVNKSSSVDNCVKNLVLLFSDNFDKMTTNVKLEQTESVTNFQLYLWNKSAHNMLRTTRKRLNEFFLVFSYQLTMTVQEYTPKKYLDKINTFNSIYAGMHREIQKCINEYVETKRPTNIDEYSLIVMQELFDGTTAGDNLKIIGQNKNYENWLKLLNNILPHIHRHEELYDRIKRFQMKLIDESSNILLVDKELNQMKSRTRCLLSMIVIDSIIIIKNSWINKETANVQFNKLFPPQLTPLIKPIMNSLKTDQMSCDHSLSSKTLARLLQVHPVPFTKIFANLLKMFFFPMEENSVSFNINLLDESLTYWHRTHKVHSNKEHKSRRRLTTNFVYVEHQLLEIREIYEMYDRFDLLSFDYRKYDNINKRHLFDEEYGKRNGFDITSLKEPSNLQSSFSAARILLYDILSECSSTKKFQEEIFFKLKNLKPVIGSSSIAPSLKLCNDNNFYFFVDEINMEDIRDLYENISEYFQLIKILFNKQTNHQMTDDYCVKFLEECLPNNLNDILLPIIRSNILAKFTQDKCYEDLLDMFSDSLDEFRSIYLLKLRCCEILSFLIGNQSFRQTVFLAIIEQLLQRNFLQSINLADTQNYAALLNDEHHKRYCVIHLDKWTVLLLLQIIIDNFKEELREFLSIIIVGSLKTLTNIIHSTTIIYEDVNKLERKIVDDILLSKASSSSSSSTTISNTNDERQQLYAFLSHNIIIPISIRSYAATIFANSLKYYCLVSNKKEILPSKFKSTIDLSLRDELKVNEIINQYTSFINSIMTPLKKDPQSSYNKNKREEKLNNDRLVDKNVNCRSIENQMDGIKKNNCKRLNSSLNEHRMEMKRTKVERHIERNLLITSPPKIDYNFTYLTHEQLKYLSNNLSVSLRNYQWEGIDWMWFLHKHSLQGILADDMGLGKTIQTICILLLSYEEQKMNDNLLPSLIIAPSTIVNHWANELRRLTKLDLSIYIYSGQKNEKKLNVNSKTDKKKLRTISGLNDAQFVITSYDIARKELPVSCHSTCHSPLFRHWLYCVLDEGHVIKSAKSRLSQTIKSLKSMTTYRLILSGTPVQNNVSDLYSLFDFLMPGYLGETEAQFNHMYGRLINRIKNTKVNATEYENGMKSLKILHNQVLPFMLRRLKGAVLKELPPKIIQNIYCQKTHLQCLLYEDFGNFQHNRTDEATYGFGLEYYYRQVCNHPQLVHNTNHPLYKKVEKYLKNHNENITDICHSGKLMALKDLLHQCNIGTHFIDTNNTNNTNNKKDAVDTTSGNVTRHRALIFCQVKEMLDIIEENLFRKELNDSVNFLRLDGNNSKHSVEIVQNFNEDVSIDVLLLTTSVGGLGLNICGANTVIMMELDWNPTKDAQAIDRAHRMGQRRTVFVYRIITEQSVEEKIDERQLQKSDITNKIIGEDNSSFSKMHESQQMIESFGEEAKLMKSGGKKKKSKKAPYSINEMLKQVNEEDEK